MRIYVIHSKWMQVISREPNVILSLVPGCALKPQGRCQRSLLFFAMIRKEVKAELHLWLKVLIIHCRPLHIQKEIWGTGKDVTWHISVKGEEQRQTIHKSTSEVAAQVACDL